jgi:hypothetical protein
MEAQGKEIHSKSPQTKKKIAEYLKIYAIKNTIHSFNNRLTFLAQILLVRLLIFKYS